jgi:hypothetical protein
MCKVYRIAFQPPPLFSCFIVVRSTTGGQCVFAGVAGYRTEFALSPS